MSERNEAYEEVQRYHVYNVGGEDTYCRDEDVAELEAKYCKLTEAHHIAVQALKYIAMMSDFPMEVPIDYSHFVKKELATKTLKRLAEVME